MALKKITDSDLAGKGVVGMADTPGLSAREMQEKVEEVVRSVVIPFFNANVDETVSREDLAQAVFASGAGDMLMAVYDADKDGVIDRAAKADNGFDVYVHSKTGTVHRLAGAGGNAKFMPTEDWLPGDSLTVNGQEADLYNQLAEDISGENIFRKGVVTNCFVEKAGERYSCFFKTGGAGIPDGKTSPANNIITWQKCAGLNTGYTTSAEILVDAKTLNTLVNNANAMEYLIRSVDIQAEVLPDSRMINCLDNSLPIVSPSMQGITAPYGKVTHNGFDYNVHLAFNYPPLLTETTPSAYFGNVSGAYVQYEFDSDGGYPWVYKVSTAGYGTRQYRIAAVLEDDSVVYLTDWVDNESPLLPSVYQEIMAKPHSYKCKAVRIYVTGDAVNNYNYLRGGKIWGK
ncbi:MAG: hypothetical protein IKU54_03920 [Oscillospiraceae bacterium]|nr:hypothetical protein [Oscillospiraceae bacterium]